MFSIDCHSENTPPVRVTIRAASHAGRKMIERRGATRRLCWTCQRIGNQDKTSALRRQGAGTTSAPLGLSTALIDPSCFMLHPFTDGLTRDRDRTMMPAGHGATGLLLHATGSPGKALICSVFAVSWPSRDGRTSRACRRFTRARRRGNACPSYERPQRGYTLLTVLGLARAGCDSLNLELREHAVSPLAEHPAPLLKYGPSEKSRKQGTCRLGFDALVY
jgi:hypothetical protein